MKKLFCILVGICLLLCSCGGAEPKTNTEDPVSLVSERSEASIEASTFEESSADTSTGEENICFLAIDCATILNNLENLNSDKADILPTDGIILEKTEISFASGETVYDLLIRVCKEKEIQTEATWSPMFDSYYINGIGNIYELDCGEMSGWMFCVNGEFPSVGCNQYEIAVGDVIEFRYSCDWGADIGLVFE